MKHALTHCEMCTSLHDLMCILKACSSEQPPHYDSNDATVKWVGADFSTSHRRKLSVPQCFYMWIGSTCRSTVRLQRVLKDCIILVLMIWNNIIRNMQCFIAELRCRHAVMYWSLCGVKAASWQFTHAHVSLCRCMTLTWLLEWEADQNAAYTF